VSKVLSDKFLALNVVLANGSIVRVSAGEHVDLSWAMQGTGQNVGIVDFVDYSTSDIRLRDVGGRSGVMRYASKWQ
jgi:hypothetical protein